MIITGCYVANGIAHKRLSDHPPPHVHIRREGKLAKVRLDTLNFERTDGFNASERSKIITIIREHQTFLLDAWASLHPDQEADKDE